MNRVLFRIALAVLCTNTMLLAQVSKGDLSLWFQTIQSTEHQEVQVVPTLLNRGNEPVFLYYQADYGKPNMTQHTMFGKQKGMVALFPNDTTTVFLEYNPIPLDSVEREIRFFLTENEYVLLKCTWNSKSIQPRPPKSSAPVAEQKALENQHFEAKEQTIAPQLPSKSEKIPNGTPSASTESPNLQSDAVALAQEANSKKQTSQTFLANDDFEIAGLVFNETRTRFGAEFYRKLSEVWTPPQGVGSYWITVRELPSPGRFTILSVQLNNRELFQRNLFPRPSYIESLAVQTANLLNNLLKQGNYDGSLSNSDLFGEGIE